MVEMCRRVEGRGWRLLRVSRSRFGGVSTPERVECRIRYGVGRYVVGQASGVRDEACDSQSRAEQSRVIRQEGG
jgi:hypothetical protein